MQVVVVGGGRIGRYITRDLVAKGHRVVVIEREASRVEDLVAETGILAIQGEATDTRYLAQARTELAQVVVATTHEDEVNLVACQLARIEFGVTRVISRVNDPRNVELFQRVGIEAVSSTRLISELIEAEFSVGELAHLTSLRGGRVGLVELRIPDGADAPGPRRIETLGLPDGANLVVLFRGDETIVPRGGTELRPGDEVVALVTPDVEAALTAVLLGTA